LDDAATVDEAIRAANPALILNCATPFANSAPALVDACIRLKKHYVDICSDLAVLERVHAEDSRAVWLPGCWSCLQSDFAARSWNAWPHKQWKNSQQKIKRPLLY
jgi:hypothetical protein